MGSGRQVKGLHVRKIPNMNLLFGSVGVDRKYPRKSEWCRSAFFIKTFVSEEHAEISPSIRDQWAFCSRRGRTSYNIRLRWISSGHYEVQLRHDGPRHKLIDVPLPNVGFRRNDYGQ